MKKSKFVFGLLVLSVFLIVSCKKENTEYSNAESKKETETEMESETEVKSLDAISVEEQILNYLNGDWIEYYEGEVGYTFVVKSPDEVYENFYRYYYNDIVEKGAFLNDIKKELWGKDNVVITDKGFKIIDEEDERWIYQYTFDYSEVKNNNIDDIILHRDFYFDGQLMNSHDFVRPGKEYVQPEPQIGMTYEEVEASTWGKPYKINKTTYSWGIKEQWCYSVYRYIYFENGVVTAISE